MKKILLSLSLLISFQSYSQTYDWVKSAPLTHSSNPSNIIAQMLVDYQNNIYDVRTDSVHILFGQLAYGEQILEKRNQSGTLLSSFTFGPKCSITQITADKTGKVYIAGSYMETLNINNSDSMPNSSIVQFNTNTFIICINNQQILGKRNITGAFGDPLITAMAIDNNNNCWLGYSDFNDGTLEKVNFHAQQTGAVTITGAKTIAGMSFDPFNNLYVSGAAEGGNFSMGNLSYTVPTPYSLFVARFKASMQPSWARFAHDETFHYPQIKADPFGNAFLCSPIMDSVSFGSVYLEGPQWVFDFAAVKVDSTGNFIWGVEVPHQATITGDYDPGNGNFIDCDNNGNLYIGGTVRFNVDFGNNVIADATPLDYDAISFLAISAAGVPQWTLSGGSNNFQNISSIALDLNDDLIFSGTIRDTATFGSIILLNQGSTNFLLGKISTPDITGLNSISENEKSIVYPNPSNGELNIPASLSDHSFKVYDISGRIVYSLDKINQSKIDLRQLKAGIYLLSFNNGDDNFTSRWVKTGKDF